MSSNSDVFTILNILMRLKTIILSRTLFCIFQKKIFKKRYSISIHKFLIQETLRETQAFFNFASDWELDFLDAKKTIIFLKIKLNFLKFLSVGLLFEIKMEKK
jgi:hypothetical protein